MKAEHRRCEAGVQQSIENGSRSCMNVCMFICMYISCFPRIFQDYEHLQKRMWYHMVGSLIMHCLGMCYLFISFIIIFSIYNSCYFYLIHLIMLYLSIISFISSFGDQISESPSLGMFLCSGVFLRERGT